MRLVLRWVSGKGSMFPWWGIVIESSSSLLLWMSSVRCCKDVWNWLYKVKEGDILCFGCFSREYRSIYYIEVPTYYYVMCTNANAHHWGRFHNMTFLRFDKTPTHLHTNVAAMKFITFLWVILSFIKVSGNVLKNHSWLLALDTVALQGTTTLEMMGPNKGFRRELNARGLLSRRKAMINCIGTFQSTVYDLFLHICATTFSL